MNVNWEKLEKLALAEVEATLIEMPKPLREQARKLPVTFEKVANNEVQADAIEVDTLSLFIGSKYGNDGGSIFPPNILLFLKIWDSAGGEAAVFCDEVRTTFLHELGHYFGLGAAELIDRGLE